MHRSSSAWLVILFALLMPSLAAAQGALARGTLTGTVRDASGGVLPGVTVEAASPALIEKVRTAVTDSAGVYRIVNLDPGVYTLTFTLEGFSQVKRENIELSGSATLTIPIEMRVGNLTETIIVTGESPVVDVQSTRREAVIDGDVISVLPGTRSTGSLITMIPGVETFGAALNPSPGLVFFFARGGPNSEGRFNVNGMPVANAFAGGGGSSLIYDTVNVDEIAFTVAGGMGETDVGGPVLNIVPRSGGNTFQGQAFTNFSNDALRGNNLTPELTAPTPGPNLRETPGIIKAYDANISYGGPIVRDRLWFFGSYRKLNTETAVEGVVGNANAFNLSRWDWVEDRSLTARTVGGAIDLHRAPHGAGRRETPRLGQLGVPAAMRRVTAQGRDRRLSHPRHELGCRDSDVVARGIPQLPRRPVYRRAGPLDEPDDEPGCCWKPAAPTTRIATPAVSCPFPPTAFSTSA